MSAKSETSSLLSLSQEVSSFLQPKLEELFRTLAEASGWPSNVIEAVDIVIHDDTTVALTYNNDIKAEIELLEYGNLDTIPNAVIRPFKLRAEALVQSTLENEALEDLFDLVLIGVL